MSINGQREFELLKKIGFIRTSGSEEELKAANILLEEIFLIGCEGHLEDYRVPTSKIKKASLKVEQSIYSSDSTAFADAGIPSITFCRFAPSGSISN